METRDANGIVHSLFHFSKRVSSVILSCEHTCHFLILHTRPCACTIDMGTKGRLDPQQVCLRTLTMGPSIWLYAILFGLGGSLVYISQYWHFGTFSHV